MNWFAKCKVSDIRGSQSKIDIEMNRSTPSNRSHRVNETSMGPWWGVVGASRSSQRDSLSPSHCDTNMGMPNLGRITCLSLRQATMESARTLVTPNLFSPWAVWSASVLQLVKATPPIQDGSWPRPYQPSPMKIPWALIFDAGV